MTSDTTEEVRLVTMRDLAREQLLLADGDTNTATEALVERLRNDIETLRIVIVEAIQKAAREIVEENMRRDRKAVLNAVMNKPNKPTFSGEATRAFMNRTIFDYQMKNGKRLGDCTGHECVEQGEWLVRSGQTYIQRGRWIIAVGKKDPDQPRSKVLSLKQAENLYRKHVNEGETV